MLAASKSLRQQLVYFRFDNTLHIAMHTASHFTMKFKFPSQKAPRSLGKKV